MRIRSIVLIHSCVFLAAIAGCANTNNQQLGTGAGAILGGVAGHTVFGGAAGAIGGAAAGAVIGNEVGRRKGN